MQEPLFKDGDSALLVTYYGWTRRRRSYRVVKVNKVHKTGRLTLEGSREQWRMSLSCNYFVTKLRPESRLYQDTPELRAEIDAEVLAGQKCLKLNKLGDKLGRLRDVESAAEIWDSLPQEVKDMVEGDNGE